MEYNNFKAIRKKLENFCQARDINIKDFLEVASLEADLQYAIKNYAGEEYNLSKITDEDVFNLSNTILSNPVYREDREAMLNTSLEYTAEKKEIKHYKVSLKEGLELINKLEKGEKIERPFYFKNENEIYNSVIPTSWRDKYFIEAFHNESIAKKYIENEDIPIEILLLEDNLITLYDEEDPVKVTESLKYNLFAVEEIEGHSIVSKYASLFDIETRKVFENLLTDIETSDCDSFGDLISNIKDDLKLEDYLESKILEEPTLISQNRLESGLLMKLKKSGGYFEVHTTDTGFDFTLYDNEKNEVDGGLKLYRSPEVKSDYLPLSYILKECAAMIDRENDVKLENIALYDKGYCIEDDLPDVSEEEPEM